ncbi:uncharacterized protein LOC127096349 [Lathyrus oleraceus]|uniref:uncharacterized protein LOC127096349 n=1 Tax=Pisum sativum TaxID=3888 RepID=UPI0021D3420D|nr:uncharacterized protein LOC127096349 [Pisum sativum]
MAQDTKPGAHPVTGIGEPRVDNKYKMLEERLRAIEGFNVVGFDSLEMCLVPDIVIPPKIQSTKIREILPYLIQKGLVDTKPLPPVPLSPPRNFDANARCDYHADSQGHTTEKCLALKFKVQDLLDRKIISCTKENQNMKNPMLGHVGLVLNAIGESEDHILIRKVDQVKTPMTRIPKKLIVYGLFKNLHANCKVCLFNPEQCEKMKRCLKKMMDQGLVQIGNLKKVEDISAIESQGHIPIEIPYQRREIQTPVWIPFPISFQISFHTPLQRLIQIPMSSTYPIVFHIPAPFLFESTKSVPQNYNATTYVREKPLVLEPAITNIAGIRGMTRRGRLFAPEQPPKRRIPESSKGKESISSEEGPSQKTASREEAEEFLRLIKKSDYKMVDRLNQTTSKISTLYLLLGFVAHREALLKILNEAYVTKHIMVDQFEGVVANITASSCLGFSSDELPPEGHAHNKALHIPVKFQDSILSRVSVVTESSLNVMLKNTLMKLNDVRTLMKTSTLVVKTFDCSKIKLSFGMTLGPCYRGRHFDTSLDAKINNG